jgi:DNA recombination protein RmuC
VIEILIIVIVLAIFFLLDRRIADISKNVRGSVDDKMSVFQVETARIRESLSEVQKSVQEMSSFQDIFRSPKLRGQWGEASLENNILHEYFPVDMYKREYLFKSGERVDAVLKLPDNSLLPIDAKFPWDNFRRMAEAKTNEERDSYHQLFVSSAKKKIDDIAQKYILPGEGTTDMALMYVPAETVFYEIINSTDLPSYARRKKVVIVSPSTAYLTLSTIITWRRNTEIQEKTKDILRCLEALPGEWEKLSDSWRKVGSHLRNADLSYQDSQKRLERCSDKVKNLIKQKYEDSSN